MSRLLWREYCRNRWILAVGATGVLLPIIIAMAFNLNGSSGFIYPFFLSCVFSQMAVALLGANAVAGECSDRSDEFMRRSNTFASKRFFPVITVVAACIGFVAPLLLFLPLIVSVEIGNGPRLHEMGRKDYIALASLNAMICLAVAAVCFSVATWNYFRSIRELREVAETEAS